MDKITAKEVIDASMGRIKADVVFRNAMVVDVFNCRSFKSDVYVKDGRFVGFDGEREAEKEIDAKGRYMGIYHVAIYVGNGMAVEALNEDYGVVYQKLRTNKACMVCRPNM